MAFHSERPVRYAQSPLFRWHSGGKKALRRSVSDDTIGGGMQRPSHAEILSKILKARQKVAAKDWLVADIGKLLPEFHALDRWTLEEQTEALAAALGETRPEDYAGSRPPQRSYERACKGAELFAFVWESGCFRRRMYLKICFVRETLYIVSFHPAKFAKESEP